MEKKLPREILSASGAVASRVSLDQVFIKTASFSSSGNRVSASGVDRNHLTHRNSEGTYSFNAEGNILEVEIEFSTTLVGKKVKDPTFHIKAAFVARYHLTTNPPPEALYEQFFGSFAKSNALLNVWPYWREFASSCNDRMGIPHWNLPVLRLIPKPSRSKKSDGQIEQKAVSKQSQTGTPSPKKTKKEKT